MGSPSQAPRLPLKIMREIIKNLNKKSLADSTGISYSRLRKYASGEVKKLTQEEIELVHIYLLNCAKVFEVKDDR